MPSRGASVAGRVAVQPAVPARAILTATAPARERCIIRPARGAAFPAPAPAAAMAVPTRPRRPTRPPARPAAASRAPAGPATASSPAAALAAVVSRWA